MFYLRPSTDFFGPKASQYRDFCGQRVEFHLIPQCGLKKVKAIDVLASAIAATSSQPAWQRRDGSIDYTKLPLKLKVLFNKEDFDEKGYIDLERIHIYSITSLLEQSRIQRDGREQNQCRLVGGEGCWGKTNPMRSVTTCAALTYRLIEGSSFDVRRHTYGKVFQQSVDSRTDLKEYSRLFTLRFDIIWTYAEALKKDQQGYLSYLCRGIAAIFSMIFCRSTVDAAA
ncbi:MAG: hypothetical protein P0S93_01215 [Candidatus Neptunochlamydia sp.]|nr:hypothetical protein [Candidatus Neptunochlamydia sp.]